MIVLAFLAWAFHHTDHTLAVIWTWMCHHQLLTALILVCGL